MSARQPDDNQRFLTIRQLSELSTLSITQIRRLAKAGKIPFYQPAGKGGKLLFPADAIQQCMKGETVSRASSEDCETMSGKKPLWMNE